MVLLVLLVTLLMLLIGIRIIIQVVLVFLIPGLVILVAGYLATVALPITTVIVGGIVGAVGLVTASYLNGVVDIFAYAVWTFTFLDLTSEKELSAREVLVEEPFEEENESPAPHRNLS